MYCCKAGMDAIHCMLIELGIIAVFKLLLQTLHLYLEGPL